MSTTQDCKDLLNSNAQTSPHGASGWKRLWKTNNTDQIQRVFSNSISTFFVQVSESESGLRITAMGDNLDAVAPDSPASTAPRQMRP